MKTAMQSPHLRKQLDFVAGIGLVGLSRLALRLRLRRRVDGWRRGAGLVLRGEAATFVLSAFGLNVWSDDERPSTPGVVATQSQLARRLSEFLAGEPGVRICVRRGKHEDGPESCRGPSYTLGFEPRVEGPSRFVRPDDWSGTDHRPQDDDRTADPLLNFVCRIDPDGRADIWVRVNHVGADGVPIQELLTRLERAWGIGQDVLYPTAERFAPCSIPRPCAGRADLVELQAFIDFSPLLAWRQRNNNRLPEPMTVSAALLWCLACHPAFAGLYMGSTVEIPAGDGLGRGVGFVVVRPSDYFDRPDGLMRYVRDFNHRLDLTRRRASNGCLTIDAAGLIPPRLAEALLRHGLEQGTRAMGSLGLTMLKDARVFGAPIADVGHVNGFIAVGSMTLPTEGGGRVGCVTIKGPAAKIARYPGVFQDAIQQLTDMRLRP